MTQFEKSAPRTLITEHGVLMYLATIALIVMIGVGAVILSQAASPAAVEVRSQAGEVVDGWMPGITAANRAATLDEARVTQDGWSSALLRPEPVVTDGWSSRYLVDDD
jgi:hypothetical protein